MAGAMVPAIFFFVIGGAQIHGPSPRLTVQ
jgi:hypothetical protein